MQQRGWGVRRVARGAWNRYQRAELAATAEGEELRVGKTAKKTVRRKTAKKTARRKTAKKTAHRKTAKKTARRAKPKAAPKGAAKRKATAAASVSRERVYTDPIQALLARRRREMLER